MSIDDRIKRELEAEAEEIDQILNEKGSLLDVVSGSFRYGLTRWIAVAYVCAFVVSGLMIWAGYEFYVAETVDARIFSGVWLIVTLAVQIALKQWTWMEVNRTSLLREIKRLEVSVVKLSSKIDRGMITADPK